MFSLQRIIKLIHSTVWLIKGLGVGEYERIHVSQYVCISVLHDVCSYVFLIFP